MHRAAWQVAPEMYRFTRERECAKAEGWQVLPEMYRFHTFQAQPAIFSYPY